MGMVLSKETMLQPYFEIFFDGKKLDSSLKKYITSVEVEESDTEADIGRITVADLDFKFSNMTKLAKKMPVKIYMGHVSHHRLMLQGEVAYIEADFGEDGVPYIVIGAVDNTFMMTSKKKSRKWENKKASEIVREIAKEYGFKAKVDESLNIIEQITQEEETDAQLVARLADDEGFVFFYTSDTNILYWGERFEGLTASESLYYNSGDFSVQSFKPTLVQKNKAELVEEKDSSISDATGGTVTEGTGDGSIPSTSNAGGQTYIPISTLDGSVGGGYSPEQGIAGMALTLSQASADDVDRAMNSVINYQSHDDWEESVMLPKSPNKRYYGGEQAVAGMALTLSQVSAEDIDKAMESVKNRRY